MGAAGATESGPPGPGHSTDPRASPGSSLHTKGLPVPQRACLPPKLCIVIILEIDPWSFFKSCPEGGWATQACCGFLSEPNPRRRMPPAAGLRGPVGTRRPGSYLRLWVLVPEPARATRDIKANMSPSSRWGEGQAPSGGACELMMAPSLSGAGGGRAGAVAGAGGPDDLAVRIPCELRGTGSGRGLRL